MFFASITAPFLINNWTISAWPYWEAATRAVHPSLLSQITLYLYTVLTFAPFAISILTISTWPSTAARISAVIPFLFYQKKNLLVFGLKVCTTFNQAFGNFDFLFINSCKKRRQTNSLIVRKEFYDWLASLLTPLSINNLIISV